MTERVGSYEVERVLARGGMAVVYLARQPALDRWVALKRLDLTSGQPSLAQRFVDEARVAARLDHPNIVTVHDLLEHEGTPYIAMEYVSGGSLRPLIGRLDLCQVIGVLDDVLAGLAHAARHGITHRDLKPENVLVTPRGSCKIADFGIALAHDAVTRHTSTGTALGTPVYMAPEQARGEGADPRTDLYAVGVMGYELLAGRPPFPADASPLAVLYRHVHDPVPPLQPAVESAPESLVAWVEWLLAKAPDERPADAETARRALEELAVASLGAYWRREAALAAPGPAAEPRAPAPMTGPTTAPPREPATAVAPRGAANGPATSATRVVPPLRRRPAVRYAAAAGAVLAVAAGVALGARDGSGGPGAGGARAAPPFALGGGQAVAAGLPAARLDGAPRGSGAVVLLAGDRSRVLTVARPEPRASFGTAVASADFDRDGRADVAVGSPGARAGAPSGRRGAVDVFAAGEPGDPARIAGPDDHLERRSAGFGAALAAGDLDGDGYGDLVAGAPGSDPFPVEDGGSGSIRVLFGGPRGLTEARARVLRRPRSGQAGFGSILAVADLDGDGRLDVVEAGPDHSAYCPGTPEGPQECRAMSGAGAAALATGDLTGDGRADVVHGVPGDTPEAPGGQVRVYRGTARGPAERPLRLDQDAPHVPGSGQAGDRFGAALASADVDRDRHADVLVGAPGEDGGAGRVVLIRGAGRGYAATGNRGFEQGAAGMPGAKRAGNAFGAAVAFRPRGAGGLDLVLAASGWGAAGTVWLLQDVSASVGAADVRSVSLARAAGPGRDGLSLAG